MVLGRLPFRLLLVAIVAIAVLVALASGLLGAAGWALLRALDGAGGRSGR